MSLSDQIDPGQFHILVCDDEESIRSLLAEALADWGFPVKTAPNGEAALEYVEAGNLPHIVLTDIRMGGITGVDLAKKLKAISKEIEVIIMTSHGSLETAVEAMRLGVYDYLTKPFDNIEDVKNVITHVCERIYLKYYTEYLMGELKRSKEEVEGLANLSTDLAKHLNPVNVITQSCKSFSESFGKAPFCYFQYIPDRNSFVAAVKYPVSGAFSDLRLSLPISSLGATSPEKNPEILTDPVKNAALVKLLDQPGFLEDSQGKYKGGQWHIQPMVTHGVVRGFFAGFIKDWEPERHTVLMQRYAQTISTFYENALLHTQVLESSIRDSLTGLFNVRHFRERLKHEIELAHRYRFPVSVLFMDVDHFKKYNDTNGHPAGDQVLKMVAALLKKTFRVTEIIARYGGEEFVVMMYQCGLEDAFKKAEQFRKVVEDTPFPNGHSQPLGKVTVSIGVAEFPGSGADPESVVKAADDALYESKKISRNKVSKGIPAEGYIPPFMPAPLSSAKANTEPGPKKIN